MLFDICLKLRGAALRCLRRPTSISLAHGRTSSSRHLLLDRPDHGAGLVPAGGEHRGRPPALLRHPVRHRGGRLQLLRPATSDTARLWAERTPPGFVFHIKAFGMLTRHGVQPEQLPPPLRSVHDLELDRQGRIVHPLAGAARAGLRLFSEALEPLRAEGKLGLILMQFPPYFVANDANRDYIAYSDRPARARQGGGGVPARLLGGAGRARDDPRTCSARSARPTSASTSPGSKRPSVLPPLLPWPRGHSPTCASTAATPPPGTPGWSSAAERFKYLYSEEELSEWVAARAAAARSETATTYVMFNNCYADYAPAQRPADDVAARRRGRRPQDRRWLGRTDCPSKETGGAPRGAPPEKTFILDPRRIRCDSPTRVPRQGRR